MQRRAESKRAICPLCEESGHSPTRPNNTAHCPALPKSARRTYGPRRRLFPRVAELFSPARSEPLLTSPGAIRFCPPNQRASLTGLASPCACIFIAVLQRRSQKEAVATASAFEDAPRNVATKLPKVLRFRCKASRTVATLLLFVVCCLLFGRTVRRIQRTA